MPPVFDWDRPAPTDGKLHTDTEGPATRLTDSLSAVAGNMLIPKFLIVHVPRPSGSLIPSLIHPRTPASISVHRTPLSRQVDLRSESWTMIPNPEKQKVDSPILPSTTDLTDRSHQCWFWYSTMSSPWSCLDAFPIRTQNSEKP